MSNLYISKRFVLMVHITEQCTAQNLDLAVWRAGNENESSFEGTELLCISYFCRKLLQTTSVWLGVTVVVLLYSGGCSRNVPVILGDWQSEQCGQLKFTSALPLNSSYTSYGLLSYFWWLEHQNATENRENASVSTQIPWQVNVTGSCCSSFISIEALTPNTGTNKNKKTHLIKKKIIIYFGGCSVFWHFFGSLFVVGFLAFCCFSLL